MVKFLSYLRVLRKYLVLMFTFAFYMLSIYYFFVDPKILIGLIFAIMFFAVSHYFIIELRKTEIWNLILSIVVLTILVLFIVWFDNFFYTIWIILFHLSIIFLFFDVYEEVYNRIVINSWKLFTMWVKMFSLTLSAVFAFSFLWTYRSFNLTCDQIYDFVKKASQMSANYFWVQLPQVKDVKLKEVVNKIQPMTGEVLTWKKLSLNEALSVSFWKNAVVNQIMENKKLLDKNICQIIVWNIKKMYNKPWFQFSVMFLIFLLFYPLIRLFTFVLAFLNFLMFQLAKWARIYKYTKVLEEVEVLE